MRKCFAPPPPPPPPKSFCTPSNYTYFDLIFSYLVILITKFVKLLILWSQMPPCRPRKQGLLNIFLGLSGRYHQAPAKASSSTPPPPLDIYPPPPERKYENPSLLEINRIIYDGFYINLYLIWFIKDNYWTFVIRFRCILKILNFF